MTITLRIGHHSHWLSSTEWALPVQFHPEPVVLSNKQASGLNAVRLTVAQGDLPVERMQTLAPMTIQVFLTRVTSPTTSTEPMDQMDSPSHRYECAWTSDRWSTSIWWSSSVRLTRCSSSSRRECSVECTRRSLLRGERSKCRLSTGSWMRRVTRSHSHLLMLLILVMRLHRQWTSAMLRAAQQVHCQVSVIMPSSIQQANGVVLRRSEKFMTLWVLRKWPRRRERLHSSWLGVGPLRRRLQLRGPIERISSLLIWLICNSHSIHQQTKQGSTLLHLMPLRSTHSNPWRSLINSVHSLLQH